MSAFVNSAVASNDEAIEMIPTISRPAGIKPQQISLPCSTLSQLHHPNNQPDRTDRDQRYVERLLLKTSPTFGQLLINMYPEDVMWWVRMNGDINIISVATSIHEVNHQLNRSLYECNGGAATYHLNGHIYRTELRPGEMPSISIVSKTLPTSLKNRTLGSRYPQYIEKNAVNPANDFSVLMEELIAYIGAADFELSVVQSPNYSPLTPSHLTAIDVNSGGMVDFMVYLLAYVKALRMDHQDAYARLKSWPKTVHLIQLSWSHAERILLETYPHTVFASQGGKLKVSRESLSVAYSDEFLSELDKLGVSHSSASVWQKNYFASAP